MYIDVCLCCTVSCIEMRTRQLKECCGRDYYKNLVKQVTPLNAVTPAAHQVIVTPAGHQVFITPAAHQVIVTPAAHQVFITPAAHQVFI